MNDDIHFGEVEQAAPRRALRPDENRHYAVVPHGEPREGELPIFVDLDVLADMEAHSQSDTSVELGGVLLGACYLDQRGQPFVVISDSLRATHYESSRGSFKFTHDTWAAITRERAQFPAELSMVGWYHTHPDWGVFLSGMDLFICDHFFNKPLDVAYVIDPCRGERGMFQWTGGSPSKTTQTGGFFVTASRFRAAELEYYVAELCSAMAATSTTRPTAGSQPPVVHLHQPREHTPAWQPMAVIGMLTIQFLLVAILAWKLLAVPVVAPTDGDKNLTAALERLDASLKAIEARRSADLAEERTRAKTEFLDAAFRELKNADDGAISRLKSQYEQSMKLSEDIAARDAQVRELKTLIDDTRNKLAAIESTARQDKAELKAKIAGLTTENNRLQADLDRKKEELASLLAAAPLKTASATGSTAKTDSFWPWVIGSVIAAAVIITGIWWIGSRSDTKTTELASANSASLNPEP